MDGYLQRFSTSLNGWAGKIFIICISSFAMFSSFFFFDAVGALSSPMRNELNYTVANLGYISGSYSVLNIIFIPFSGILIDHIGHNISFVLFVSTSLVGALVFALSKTVIMMAIGRMIFGVGLESGSIAMWTLFSYWFRDKEMTLSIAASISISSFGGISSFVILPWIADKFKSIYPALYLCVVVCIISFVFALITWLFDYYCNPTLSVKCNSTNNNNNNNNEPCDSENNVNTNQEEVVKKEDNQCMEQENQNEIVIQLDEAEETASSSKEPHDSTLKSDNSPTSIGNDINTNDDAITVNNDDAITVNNDANNDVIAVNNDDAISATENKVEIVENEYSKYVYIAKTKFLPILLVYPVAFWLINAVGFILFGSFLGFVSYYGDILINLYGYSEQEAGVTMSWFRVAGLFVFPVGLLVDYLGKRIHFLFVFCLCVVSPTLTILSMNHYHSEHVFLTPVLWITIMGLSYAITTSLIISSIATVVPKEYEGIGFGINSCIMNAGGVAIPMIMGYTSDTVQSYESILIVLLIMALIASVVCFCIFFTKSHVVLSKGMQV